MKVRDRIAVIVDLFLGAAHADGRFVSDEKEAVRRLLSELILREPLPEELETQIQRFRPELFSLARSAADFALDPPMNKRRLLELTAQVCMADGEFDLAEDDYLHALAQALGMHPADYGDIVLDYEMEELRRTFELLRRSSMELAAPPA
jgi:tellurite resistance protein